MIFSKVVIKDWVVSGYRPSKRSFASWRALPRTNKLSRVLSFKNKIGSQEKNSQEIQKLTSSNLVWWDLLRYLGFLEPCWRLLSQWPTKAESASIKHLFFSKTPAQRQIWLSLGSPKQNVTFIWMFNHIHDLLNLFVKLPNLYWRPNHSRVWPSKCCLDKWLLERQYFQCWASDSLFHRTLFHWRKT